MGPYTARNDLVVDKILTSVDTESDNTVKIVGWQKAIERVAEVLELASPSDLVSKYFLKDIKV